jgi:hypothetical protein|tara:strand:- start:372 stop:608 length:237 start_codon:yes stop_codon:yes gene_type:complete
MTWKDIIKVDVIGDSQKAIDNIGNQIDLLKELDEMIRKFNNEEDIDGDEFEDLVSDYRRTHMLTIDVIKRILFTMKEA